MTAEDARPEVETLATILHPTIDGTGSYCPWERKTMCPGWNASRHAARDILAAGYLSPAEVEARERAAEVRALREAADEYPGWWKFTRWLRDRADRKAGEGK